MILEHVQALKNDLQQQIHHIDEKFDGKFDRFERKMDQGFEQTRVQFENIRIQFEEARQHRQALQEDLEATMKVQMKHGRQLTKMQRT